MPNRPPIRDQSLYDRIGTGYDFTREADPYITSRLAALLQLRSSGECLDLACGTGNYTSALFELTAAQWTGCDNSERMLSVARGKHSAINWCVADVDHLPFAGASFDGVLCTNAVHHFPQLEKAFASVRSVVRTGAQLVIFSATREQMQQYWLNEYFPKAMARSSASMPSERTLLNAAHAAGFSLTSRDPYFIQPELRDRFLFSGKHDPIRYLDPRVRAGISTFAAHAAQEEVAVGCTSLAHDIETGKFEEIAATFNNADGDYSFFHFHAS